VSREGRDVATGQALSLPGHGQLCVAHISVNIIIITVLNTGGERGWRRKVGVSTIILRTACRTTIICKKIKNLNLNNKWHQLIKHWLNTTRKKATALAQNSQCQ
jgi:hypothetical protein